MARVRTGLEILLWDRVRRLKGKRIGLVAHQASVDGSLRHAIDLIGSVKGARLRALFAPEHGVWGEAQDHARIPDARDPRTRRRIWSLYGRRKAPTPAMLRDLDLLILDLQDIGARYYTFVWTMTLTLAACARARTPLMVLDRPNPLGGRKVEGNVLDPGFTSFVGLHPVPVVHGMTMGELAWLFNERLALGATLEVVPMRGWRREMGWEETGLPWVAPSPNMPTPETARVYPGACLVEGTNLSEGRGTTRPFEYVGAPFMDPHRWAAALNALDLPGARFRPCYFRPAFHKYKNQVCGGIQWHVQDRGRFKPYLAGLAVIATARQLAPTRFTWRNPPYEFEQTRLPIDLLCGTDRIRRAIETGLPARQIEASWERELARFKRLRRGFLLYQ
jgi:uncharacterized protein YbbC (DUF1343 family)